MSQNQNRLIFLLGEPGIGKSTLMAALTKHMTPTNDETVIPYNDGKHHVPFIHWDRPELNREVLEIGVRRANFSGADALGLHMQPVVCLWLQDRPGEIILAEGDRLASDKFFTVAQEAGYALDLLYLHGPRVAAERRAARGSQQNASWVRGRQTRAYALAHRWPVVELDASLPVKTLAAAARRELVAASWL